MTDKDNQRENVVDMASARRVKKTNTKPRHVKKQEARAQKAKTATANRVRSGRSKAQKAQDKASSDKLHRLVDGARLDKTPDTNPDN